MTKPDFSKMFAQNGATTALTDQQFLQGFGYLGDNPPTVEEFNWLFQEVYLRLQWLNQNAGFGRWQGGYAYSVGDVCFASAIGSYKMMECTVTGISGTTEPAWPAVGQTITDGGVTWKVCDMRQGTNIGRLVALVDVGGGKVGLPAVSGKLLTDISGLPIGTPHQFLATAAPAGWLAIDSGALVNRATYPDLWAFVQSSGVLITEAAWQAQAAAQPSVGFYSSGDGSTTFRLPRIVDFVSGTDVGRPAGTYRADQLQGHWHRTQTGAYTGGNKTWPTGTTDTDNMDVTDNNGNSNANWAFEATTIVGDGVNGTPRIGNETRSKSISMMWCVKVFDVTTNQGLIDVTALANEVAGKINAADFATAAEAKAGTATTKVVSPATLKSGLNASGDAPIYACRAWAKINGVGTVSVLASGNVSSVTDNGVGDYTINFTTAIQDANYCAQVTVECVAGYNSTDNTHYIENAGQTPSSLRVRGGNSENAAYYDYPGVHIAVIR